MWIELKLELEFGLDFEVDERSKDIVFSVIIYPSIS
jgi:hypothetical protein